MLPILRSPTRRRRAASSPLLSTNRPARRTGAAPAAAILLLLGAGVVQAQVVIDSFTDAVPQVANSEMAAAVVGGFRDLRSNNASNTAVAAAGRFTCSGTAAFQGCTVQYDGFDNDPIVFTPGGFAATDFAAGGHDRIPITTFVAQGACNLLVQICDDDTPDPQCENLAVSNVGDGETIVFEYADFPPGIDFTAVTALFVNLTPTASPLDCSVGPLATDGPLFADGFESGSTSAWSQTQP